MSILSIRHDFFLAVNIWILLPIMEHVDILPTWGLEDLSASVKSLHLALPDGQLVGSPALDWA